MTNTAGTVYSALTGGIQNTFDGVLGIGVAILVVSIVYAVIKSHTKNRVRVG